MRLIFLSFSLAFLMSFSVNAQQEILINEPPSVERLYQKFLTKNQDNNQVTGWRVEILSTTDRLQFDRVKRDFWYKYPDLRSKGFQKGSFWLIRVGAFETRLEATYLLYILQNDYPSAYLIQDNTISEKELLEYNY